MLSTEALVPGNQIFILVAEDGYGESLMKIYPFTVSSGMRCAAPGGGGGGGGAGVAGM